MTKASVARWAMTATRQWRACALLCFVLTAPLSVAAAVSSADKVQQQVVSIDTRTQAKAPLRERPLQGFSAEGARVVAWGAAGTIEKISVEGLGERGRVLLDFYWQRGLLIAAHTRRVDYGAHIMELPKDKPTPTTVVEEEWLEFAGARLLRWRQLERELPVTDTAAQRRAAELKVDARSFKRLINTADVPGAAGGSCSWSCARTRASECLRYHCK